MDEHEDQVLHPNREKPESKSTKAIVTLLLLVSAGLILVITLGGWTKLQGAETVTIFYVAVYLLFAFFVSRWNRGVLPVVAALCVLLIIFAAISGPPWFERDKVGFEQPALPESLLGLLTLLLIPVQFLLITFSLRGFGQAWNVEAGSREYIEAQRRAAAKAEPRT
ncbi:hypothetical protein LCGC14_2491330 [marine sediment metagenome]|uniref:Uncharacterized protein n=1 Tax=marine sediment metagenome TaxID=412755 RepID=A0A0F9B5C0_9ZZZZ